MPSEPCRRLHDDHGTQQMARLLRPSDRQFSDHRSQKFSGSHLNEVYEHPNRRLLADHVRYLSILGCNVRCDTPTLHQSTMHRTPWMRPVTGYRRWPKATPTLPPTGSCRDKRCGRDCLTASLGLKPGRPAVSARWGMGAQSAGTQADQGRGGRLGQQDRAHPVGGDDARGRVSREGASRAAGVTEARQTQTEC